MLTGNAYACTWKELEVCDSDEIRWAQHNISLVQFLYNRQHVNMASNGKINCALCPRARRVMAILRCHEPISRRKSSQTHQQYTGCLNVCEDWWCLVLCNVNRSYVFIQLVRYFSCQTRSEDTAVLRRSVTNVIFIDDFITANNSLILTEIKGWQEGKWFLWKFGVHISRIFYGIFVSACYICSGHFWTRSGPFLGYEDNVVIDACGESKSVFSS